MTTAIVVGLIVFAFFGAPIFAILGSLAILGAAITQPDMSLAQAFAGALVRVFHLATSGEGSTLATIPLFTFMGYVLAESKTAERLVSFATAFIGWITTRFSTSQPSIVESASTVSTVTTVTRVTV